MYKIYKIFSSCSQLPIIAAQLIISCDLHQLQQRMTTSWSSTLKRRKGCLRIPLQLWPAPPRGSTRMQKPGRPPPRGHERTNQLQQLPLLTTMMRTSLSWTRLPSLVSWRKENSLNACHVDSRLTVGFNKKNTSSFYEEQFTTLVCLLSLQIAQLCLCIHTVSTFSRDAVNKSCILNCFKTTHSSASAIFTHLWPLCICSFGGQWFKKKNLAFFCIFYKRTVFLMLHKSGCLCAL